MVINYYKQQSNKCYISTFRRAIYFQKL